MSVLRFLVLSKIEDDAIPHRFNGGRLGGRWELA
jgi:hypothetical protein